MATCPHCAERIGWRASWLSEEACPHCRLGLDRGDDGQLKTWAATHGPALLQAPRGASYVFWLVGSTALTGALSLALGGVLVATVLFLVQAVSLQRATHHFFEHFTFGHRVTTDVTRSSLMLGMLVTQVSANLVLGPLSAVVNVPVYLVVWGLMEWRVRRHFELVIQGKGPPWWEVTLVAMMMGVVALPPVGLAIAVMWSWSI